MRRMSLAILATVVGVLGATSGASAATPGQFNLNFTSAKVVLGSLTELEVPGNDASLQGKAITVKANVDAAGGVTAFSNALSFPAIPLDVSGISGTVGIVQTAKSTGQFDDATGALTLGLNLGVKLEVSVFPGIPCTIPIPFTFDTGSHVVVGNKSVSGSPLAGGAISVAAVGDVPLVIPSGANCPSDMADLLSGLLAALGGGGGSMKVGIQLNGTLATPGGDPYPDPDPVLLPGDPCTSANPPASCAPPPPPALANPVATLVGTTLKSTKGSVAVPIKCAGTAATNKPCAGKATLTAKVTTVKTKKVKGKKKKVKTTKTVTLGSASYSAAAGATATPKITLSSANQKILKAAKNKLKATIAITNTGGTGVTGSAVTIKG
jgi:hypothetical protein